MIKMKCIVAATSVFVAAVTAVAASAHSVDLFIGTQGVGNVTPAAAWPFGLVQAGPDTSAAPEVFRPDKAHCGGYHFSDKWLWRFSQTHISGTGVNSLGDFGILPISGNFDAKEKPVILLKQSERAEPGYYAVDVDEGGRHVGCEIAALCHTAVYRFRFPAGERDAQLLVDLDWGFGRPRVEPGGGTWGKFFANSRIIMRKDPSGTVKGGHKMWLWCGYEYHFAMKASVPVKSMKTLREPDGARGGIHLISFGEIPGGELVVRLALSAKSADDAERNMNAESPEGDFEKAKVQSAAAWNDRLSCLELADDTAPGVRRGLMTALYRTMVQPNLQSDVHDSRPFYSTLSLWDTFRAAHPLYTIIAPEIVPAVVDSMLVQCERQGYLPIWALGGSDNHCMIGHHAVPVIVDAYLKGLLPQEWSDRAYRAVRQSLTVNHHPTSVATWGLLKEDWDVLDKYGYYPFDKLRGTYENRVVSGESVARTYECAYDDACAARFAAALGKTEDAAFFRRRSCSWTNVFDATIGYARGKDSRGRWREPFCKYDCGSGPWNDNDFCEGGSCQYTWHVMHDPVALVEALGGKAKAGERLDGLFADKPPGPEDKGFNYDISGCIGQYVHGNEPSHHIAYFYAYTDRPEKAGPALRRIFETMYVDRPDGLCGNDDCGQMSAWYLFAALGFYPFDPCGGEYVIGAPQVAGAVLRLPNGRTLRIRENGFSREHPCVKSVALNGRPIRDGVIRHGEVMAGGELVFEMGKGRD